MIQYQTMNNNKASSFRWVICAMLFAATTVNYLDRQVLSLTWKDFIAPEFHWSDNDYGTITAVFSIIYALCNLFAGKFIDRLGTKKGYLWAIFIWSLGACLHAACGVGTEALKAVGFVSMMGVTVSEPTVATSLERAMSLTGPATLPPTLPQVAPQPAARAV